MGHEDFARLTGVPPQRWTRFPGTHLKKLLGRGLSWRRRGRRRVLSPAEREANRKYWETKRRNREMWATIEAGCFFVFGVLPMVGLVVGLVLYGLYLLVMKLVGIF